jgi:hypothetical protein
MEAMSRLFTSLAALGLLSVVFGCCHVAGICDCDRWVDHCCYGPTTPPWAGDAVHPATADGSKDKAAKSVEPVKEK